MSPLAATGIAVAAGVVVPLAAALAAARARDDRAARATTIAAAAIALIACASVAFLQREGAPIALGAVQLLRLDSVAAGMLPVAALVHLALAVGLPASRIGPRRAALLLAGLGLIGLVYLAAHLVILALAFAAVVVPAALASRAERAPDAPTPRWLYPPVASALVGAALLVALFALRAAAGEAAPGALAAARAVPGESALIIALVAVVLVRKGVFPVHGWVMPATVESPDAALIPLLTAHTGGYLLVRLVQVAPEAIAAMAPVLAGLGATGALYGAILGLAQRDLRRWVAALSVSYGGVVLMGLTAGNLEGVTGGLVQWATLSLVICGLSLSVLFVERRVGRATAERAGGIAERAPYLARAFLFFGLAGVGVPGTLGFIGEDLLVHGVLETHPVVAAVVVVATMINAVAFFRGYSECLVGPPRVPKGTPATLPRERRALGVLAFVLVAAGLSPAVFVEVKEAAARVVMGHAPE